MILLGFKIKIILYYPQSLLLVFAVFLETAKNRCNPHNSVNFLSSWRSPCHATLWISVFFHCFLIKIFKFSFQLVIGLSVAWRSFAWESRIWKAKAVDCGGNAVLFFICKVRIGGECSHWWRFVNWQTMRGATLSDRYAGARRRDAHCLVFVNFLLDMSYNLSAVTYLFIGHTSKLIFIRRVNEPPPRPKSKSY